jgi:hypothetical protein
MLHKVKPAAWMAIILICFTGLAGIAWQKNPLKFTQNNLQEDTIPKKEKANKDGVIINGDLNKALEEVQRAQENLEKQLQNKDWEKMQKDLLKAQAELNTQNIQEQVAKAMKEIDLQKIQLQTQKALKQIDWEKMQKDLQQSQAEIKANIDSKKMDAEISRAMEEAKHAMAEMKAVDMEKLQQDLEKTKEEMKISEREMQKDLEDAKKEMNENFPKTLKKELEKARVEIDHAKEELLNYKNMLDEMDKDGLLKSKEEYKIEYKNGDLFINGTKQPEIITSKYRHYFKKGNVKLTRSKDDDDNKTIHL